MATDQADLHRNGKRLPTPTDCKVVNPDFWRSGLICNKEGEPKRSLANTMHILSVHHAWSGVLAYDAFGCAVVKLKKPPMRPQDAPPDYDLGDWGAMTAALAAAKALGGKRKRSGSESIAKQIETHAEEILAGSAGEGSDP